MADTIKEFLVKLGFKVDDQSYKKFTDGVSNATKEVTALGVRATGAAAAVAAAVSEIAEQYNDLYFAAIRTGSSVSALKAFEYGSKAIGISAEQAAGSLESFNVAMLSNPGKVALLNMLGIESAGRETKDVYNDLIGVLGKMPRYLAYQFGGQFGLSPSEINLRITKRKEEIEAEAEAVKIYGEAGLSLKELADRSHDYSRATQGLSTRVGALGDQMANRLLPTMTSAANWLSSWADSFIKAGNATNGMTSILLSFIGALGGLKIVSPLLARLFPFLAPALGAATGAASLAVGGGVAAGLAITNALEAQRPKSGRAVDAQAFANLPWYKRWAANVGSTVFGMDPNTSVRELREAALWRGSSALRTKVGSGQISGSMQSLAEMLQGNVSGLDRFTAFNDSYHAGLGRHSAHSDGRALDFTLKNAADSAAVAGQIRQKLSEMGVNATVLDEYSNPSAGATGGHIHVQLNDTKLTGEGGGRSVNQTNTFHISGYAPEHVGRIKEDLMNPLSDNYRQLTQYSPVVAR